jgi:hypothetical protein
VEDDEILPLGVAEAATVGEVPDTDPGVSTVEGGVTAIGADMTTLPLVEGIANSAAVTLTDGELAEASLGLLLIMLMGKIIVFVGVR